jgi:purine-nucleoside phosphorylase
MSGPPHHTTADRVALAALAIRRRWSCPASTAVILGTGLGELADEVAVSATMAYDEIPGFARSTALAHRGRFVCGEVGGVAVLMMQGRCHLYEGYSLGDLTLPVRVLAALGVNTLIVTNAAGGLNPDYSMGDVMLIDDHINLMWLQGTVSPASAPYARTTHPAIRIYDRELMDIAAGAARRHDFSAHRGTYIGVTGPSYETRAEYRAFRRIGGDCVGMSTVPEVLAAVGCGMRVLGVSTITNVACPDAPKVVSAEEVVEVARMARPRVQTILQAILCNHR